MWLVELAKLRFSLGSGYTLKTENLFPGSLNQATPNTTFPASFQKTADRPRRIDI